MEAKKTYVIYQTEYMGDDPDMYDFVGTFRELLLSIVGDGTPKEDEETSKQTTDELAKAFEEANGDGQPGYSVWCVEDKKKVLG